jgi:hypothetical protein
MGWFHQGISGGLGGAHFDDDEATPGAGNLEASRVLRVSVRHGLFIDAIGITIQLEGDGQEIELPMHGGPGGDLTQIDLDLSSDHDQYISLIEGNYGAFVDSMTITLLDRNGNEEHHGPFGGTGGTKGYHYNATNIRGDLQGFPMDTSIGGFWGSAGAFVDAIGVIMVRPRVRSEDAFPVTPEQT